MTFRVTARLVKDLNSKTFTELKNSVEGLKNNEVHIGLPGDKIHRETKKDDKGKRKVVSKKETPSEIGVAEIGAIHEFGAPDRGIPERPWLRPGIRSGKDLYIRLNRVNIIKIIRKQMSVATALRQLGAMAAGMVQKYIRNNDTFKPLKPATIARKGSSKPLIDTGQMIQSVTYELRPKGEDK